VVARRKALHRVWKDNFVPYVAWVFVKFPEVHGFGNEDLVVMQCKQHTQLEELVKHLLARGLNMIRNGAFDDFAIVHGTHGLVMPCPWLDFRPGEKGTVRFRSADDLLNLSSAEHRYEGPGWIASRGFGFMISQEPDHDVWLDFNTGGTVVTLRSPESSRRSYQ
jgi:hypothetical protein